MFKRFIMIFTQQILYKKTIKRIKEINVTFYENKTIFDGKIRNFDSHA